MKSKNDDDLMGSRECESTMIGCLANNLRNPITTIQTCMELLKKNPGDVITDQDCNVLKMALVETERLSDLIQELLFCSRDCGVAPMELDLGRVVESALHHMAFVNPLQLQARYSGQSNLKVTGHMLQIERAIVNILTNAGEATRDQGAVSVALTSGDREGFHRIVVKDSGVGIPEYLKDKLFESFASAKTNHLGTGLTMSHQIIKAHGGELSFNPRVRKGAEFIIDLPAIGVIENLPFDELVAITGQSSTQNP